jgi:hypothetical protein
MPPSTIHAQRQALTKRNSASLTLDALLNQLPEKLEIIMGANINSNIGTLDDLHSAEFCSVLGPHGLLKSNKKGKNLLQVYLAHRLHVMNTFYNRRTNSPGHCTWTSNWPTSSGIADSHMLDVFVCSASLHKCIHNCCTCPTCGKCST